MLHKHKRIKKVARALNRQEGVITRFCSVRGCRKGLAVRLSMDAKTERRPAYEYVLKTLVLRVIENDRDIQHWKGVLLNNVLVLNNEDPLEMMLDLIDENACPQEIEALQQIHKNIERSKTQLEMSCKRGGDYNTEYQALLIQALQEYFTRTH